MREFLPVSADGRQVTGEISKMVDIQFSVYHYKTGDIRQLKLSKYMEIKKNLLSRVPVDFYGLMFFMVILVLYRKG